LGAVGLLSYYLQVVNALQKRQPLNEKNSKQHSEKPVFNIKKHYHISNSVGITPNDGDDAETLVKNADIALYRAKQGQTVIVIQLWTKIPGC